MTIALRGPWFGAIIHKIGSHLASVVKDNAVSWLGRNFPGECSQEEGLDLKASIYMSSSFGNVEPHLFLICMPLL